ncbi:hypothetical protein ACGFRB_24590 [Streptomyces sp. NPDC048718]|uniref:hypothetical protein n=1 Tax=Streptomyces sp. NPDC048718 TaxID=3365587 RepID=UPI00370FB094
MSAPQERAALTSRPSLYSYALRLAQEQPDRPFGGGHPLPDEPPGPERAGLRGEHAFAAVEVALAPLLAGPDTPAASAELHRCLVGLPVDDGPLVGAVLTMDLADKAAARAIGRHLTRTGTTRRPVSVGLALLRRLGEPEDVPYLKVLSGLRQLFGLVMAALEPLDARTAALRRLDAQVHSPETRPLVDALLSGDRREIRSRLIRQPLGPRTIGARQARWIAEALGLPALLSGAPVDPRLLAQAGRLLSRVADQHADRPELLSLSEATAAFDALVRRAVALPPTVEHAVVLLSLALDLHSGQAHVLPWRTGQREQLLDTLGALILYPEWTSTVRTGPDADATPAVRRRAVWLRHTAEQVFGAAEPPGRLRIEVALPDPDDAGRVETRFLLDGRPLLPEAFGHGPGDDPGYLLDRGALRATAEPREVKLAEASCTEGCCGALWVTVVRADDTVVWRDWRRRGAQPSRSPEPPEYRFEAAVYDAELTRASGDHGWEWPGRTTARLLDSALRARPDLWTRWGLTFLSAYTDFRDPERVVVTYAEHSVDGSRRWFDWRPADDGPPAERVARTLRRIAEEDPRTYEEYRN